MTSNRKIVLAASIVMVATLFSSISNAQFKGPMRWLGQGFSDGYHQCTPGPNSDYYDPYTIHNSLLIHQNPAAYGALPNRFRNSGPLKPGIPFWEYAAPAESLNRPGTETITDDGTLDPSQGRPNLSEKANTDQRFDVHWSNQWKKKSESKTTDPRSNNDSARLRLQNIRLGQRTLKTQQSSQRKFSLWKR